MSVSVLYDVFRRKHLVLLTVAVAALAAGVALAYFTTTVATGSNGGSKADSLPQGNAPTASVSGAGVTIAWAQNTVGGQRLGTFGGGGYAIKRYPASGGSPVTAGADCNTTITGPGATLSCTANNVAGGDWKYTVTPVLNSWRGTESAASNTVTVDATAPAPTLTSPANNSFTNTRTPTLSGTAGTAAGDANTVTVKLYNGTGTGGTVLQTFSGVPVNSGNWSVTAATLADGTYTAQVTQADSANNSGSAASTFTVDATAPAPTISSPADGSYTTNSTPTINGTAGTAPGDANTVTVRIFNGSGTGGTVAQTFNNVSVTNGGWSVVAAALTPGTYTAQVVQSDAASNDGSAAVTFSTTTLVLVTPADGSYTTDQTPVLSGTATTAGTVTVKIYSGSSATGTAQQTRTATVGANGNWSVNASNLPANGTYTARAQQGTAFSSAHTFVWDNVTPAAPAAALANSAQNVQDHLSSNSDSYYVYGEASDATSGIAGLTADISKQSAACVDVAGSSIACTSVPLEFSPTGWEIKAIGATTSTTFHWRSHLQTGKAGLTTQSYSVTASDKAGLSKGSGAISAAAEPPTQAIATAINVTNGGTNGTIDNGDTIAYTFGNPFAPTEIITAWNGAPKNVTVGFTNGAGGASDTFTIASTRLGTVNTGNPNLVTADMTCPAALTVNTTWLTYSVTINGPCAPSVAGTGQGTNTSFTWAPVGGPADVGNNPLLVTNQPTAGKHF